MSKPEDILVMALEAIVRAEDSERNEWDAVDRLLPGMCLTAREALEAYREAVRRSHNEQA